MAENTIKTLREFFTTEEKPVSLSEMSEFWKSLTELEKAYYKTCDLSI
jgi:hypothetical protein